ncbi:hypothetical protein AB0A69_27425 [Streptomyces sp. NPDC045431]|uniref:hypothetical protein n=1 Tax=Streptomyces sp. NPDC045431 TaxID=3155613 RepID=UPI0033F9EC9E
MAPSASAASRTVSLKTSDGAPGGQANLTVDWWGNGDGRYAGRVRGTVKDVEADRWCAQVRVLDDGHPYHLTPYACPKGETQPVSYDFGSSEKVVVQVCLTKSGVAVDYCSRWA